MRFIKPLDEELVVAVAARHRALITVEENAVMGGAGSAVGEVLAAAGVQVPTLHLGIPDRFIEHGSRDTCLAVESPTSARRPRERHDLRAWKAQRFRLCKRKDQAA
jgi:deoxyxylulose-5-phosphate synthase